MMKIFDSATIKKVESLHYNFIFNKQNGLFARWGETKEDDPIYAPAPEILDLEISAGGDCLGNCPFCYKGNGGNQSTHNMTFEEFAVILDKLPPTLTQIAFGIMNISTNPDFFKMMEHCRSKGIIPNYTCHGLDVTPEAVEKTAKICGAVAVSLVNKKKSYDAIKMFLAAGMKQVNIHYVLSKETYDEAFSILDEVSSDPDLRKLNAIVFLQLKKKGRAEDDAFNYLESVDQYKKLIDYAQKKGVGIGFDSCSAPMYMKSMEGTENYKQMVMLAEPCESSIFSSYINCHGEFYPCSFSEGVDEWDTGLSVLRCKSFTKDIWNHEKTVRFRDRLLHSSMCEGCISRKHCRSCPIYEGVSVCKRQQI
jgi:hypothetical protein